MLINNNNYYYSHVSFLTVAIADKAASSMGETPATNITQTETPPLDNTAEPVSESTPLLPCNGKMSHSIELTGSCTVITCHTPKNSICPNADPKLQLHS